MHPLKLIFRTLLIAPLTFGLHAKPPKQPPGEAAPKATPAKDTPKDAPVPSKNPAPPLKMNAAPENAAHALAHSLTVLSREPVAMVPSGRTARART